MGMTVLVTGASGRLGRQVVDGLLQQGHRVRAFDIPAASFVGLEGLADVEIATGDICDAVGLSQVVQGCQWVIHLAAILPPVSERDRAQTMAVNLQGTKNLVDSLEAAGGEAPLVFASSVTVYGDTASDEPPITVEHALKPCSVYGESKARAEELLTKSSYPYTVLRIGGVAVPAFLEPPDPWPFTAEQRLEFINRDDVALALVRCVGNRATLGHTLNIAGGPTWQMHGREYVRGYYDVYGVPIEEARFLDHPGSYDWYDTSSAQRMLDCQRTSFPAFLSLLKEAVEEAMRE